MKNRGLFVIWVSIFFIAPVFLATPVAHADITSNLILHYAFDDNAANTTVADSSGNGHTGTATDNTSVLHSAGKIGTGTFTFSEASSQNVDTNYIWSASDSSFTLSLWFKTSTVSQILLTAYNGQPSDLTIDLDSAGRPQCQVTDSNNHFNFTTINANYGDGAWHHIACVMDGTTLHMYIDDVDMNDVSDATWNGNYAGGSPRSILLGQFTGSMDDVRLYNRAFSAADINELVGLDANLFSRWTFDEGSGTTASDSSGNGNTGTLQNSAGWAAGKIGSFAENQTVGTGGSGSYVSTTNLTSFMSTNSTLSAWVNPTDLSGQNGFNLFISHDQAHPSLMVLSNGDFSVFDRSNTSHEYTGATVPLNTWTFLAMTCQFDEIAGVSTTTLYMNGSQVKQDVTADSACDFNQTGLIYIGTYGASIGNFGWTGAIDDVRVYTRTLSSANIAALYALGNSSPASPPAISSISVSTTTTTATVTWTTDASASSTVNYGLTSGYGSASTTDALVSSHQIILSGLTPGTVYHYEVASGNTSGVSTSSDLTFTTATDITPPNITSIASTTLTTTANVAWNTDEPATSKVSYGTASGNYTLSSTSPSLVSSHSIDLSGLSNGTKYFYVVVSADSSGNIATSSEKTLMTASVNDVTPPVISSIAALTGTSTATITWSTDESASSTLRFGLASSYGFASSSVALVTSHSIILSSLSASTTYHYQIGSADASGNIATSSDLTFTTASTSSVTLCGGSCITFHDGDVIAVLGDSLSSINLYIAYFASYFDLRYPNVHLHFRDMSRSGASIPTYTDQGQYMGWINPLAPNTVILFMTNNGGFTKDQYMSQVDDAITNYIVATSSAQPLIFDPPPLNTADGDSLMSQYSDGLQAYGIANNIPYTHVWGYLHSIFAANLASTSPIDIQDGGDEDHMGPPAHLGEAYAFLSQLDAYPEVSSTTINATTATVASEQDAVVTNVATTSAGIDFTRLDARLPMAYDDRSLPIFEIMPQIYDQSKYMLTVTGLAAGDYYVNIDGEPSGSVSSAQLASGWNMSKMISGPIHDQLQDVLDKIRTQAGLDRVTRSQLPEQTGLVQYISNANSCYFDQGLTGAALRSCLSTAISNLNTLDTAIYAASQPTSHDFSLQKASGSADTAPAVISTPTPNAPLAQGTTETTLSVHTDENATCRYDTTAQTPYIWMDNTFTTTGGTTHSALITGLLDGVSYTYYIRCEDDFGNRNLSDYTLSFSVNADPNPIAYYTFDEGTGSSAADSSGNGHTATLVNSPAWVAGKIGSHALSFNGTNNVVTVGDISDADGIGALTVTAWVKGPGNFASNAGYEIVTKYASGQGPWTFAYSGASQVYACSIINGSGTSVTGLGPIVGLSDTNWHFVSCVYNGSNITVYTDGATSTNPNDSPAQTGVIKDTTYPVCIGGISDGNTGCLTNNGLWSGTIDDVRMYKRALTATEIMDLYEQAAPVISGIATSTDTTTATITWNTDVVASSTINYGVTSSYGSASTSDSFTASHSIMLSGLDPSTVYHFQVASAGSDGAIGTSSDQTFTTAALVDDSPAVTTSAASSVASSSAVLNGFITNTNGFDATQSGFAYGTASDLRTVISTTTLGAQVGAASFQSSVSGLTPNTTYYFRAYATNTQGTGYGNIQSFTTSAVSRPTVTTGAASSITDTAAVGNGTITSTGNIDPGFRGFVYGTSIAYGATTTSTGDFSVGAFTGNLTSLTCGTTYHYAAYASSTQGLGYGSDVTFTPACLSSLTSIAATPSAASAVITWTSDVPASSKVDLGINSSYGSSTPEFDTSLRVTSHSVTLASLVPCTFYHFRVRSKDAAATEVIGSDSTFTTSGCTASAAVSTTTAVDVTGSGGTLNAEDTSNLGLSLTIPASFSSTTSQASFQAKKLDSSTFFGSVAAPSTLTLVGGYLYNLAALSDATTSLHSFDHALTVTIAYSDGDIANFDTNSLVIERYDGGSWVVLDNCTIDTTAKTVTCDTDSFSDFALFGVYTPPPSNNSGGSGSSSSSSGGGGGGGGGIVNWFLNLLNPSRVLPVATTTVAAPLNNPKIVPPLSLALVFTRNLYLGMSGNDVKQLQIFLNIHGFTVAKAGPGSRGKETMLFGAATQAAVKRFQATYAKEILYPGGFKNPTGTFGPASRKQAVKISMGQQ